MSLEKLDDLVALGSFFHVNNQLEMRRDYLSWKDTHSPVSYQVGPFDHIPCLGLEASESKKML